MQQSVLRFRSEIIIVLVTRVQNYPKLNHFIVIFIFQGSYGLFIMFPIFESVLSLRKHKMTNVPVRNVLLHEQPRVHISRSSA